MQKLMLSTDSIYGVVKIEEENDCIKPIGRYQVSCLKSCVEIIDNLDWGFNKEIELAYATQQTEDGKTRKVLLLRPAARHDDATWLALAPVVDE